jgi:hypothetical protein
MPLGRTARTGQSSQSFWQASRRRIRWRGRLGWARAGAPVTTRSRLDRMQAIGTLLVGFAAIAALLFTWQSTRATNGQLQVTEQGQITDRYNAAITNLGSTSVDVRLGGIYALQRIMQDSVRDQSTVVAVLCAFVRDHSTAATSSTAGHPPTDIQAALTVVATRDPTRDTPATVVDLTNAYLFGAYLSDAKFADAHLRGVNLNDSGVGRGRLPVVLRRFFGGCIWFACSRRMTDGPVCPGGTGSDCAGVASFACRGDGVAGQAGAGRAHSRCQQARNASFQGQVRLILSTRARAWRTSRAGRLSSR